MNWFVLALTTQPPIADAIQSTADTPSITRLVLSLFFILVLIGVLAFLWKRMQSVSQRAGLLSVQSSVSVGTRERILLVRAGEKDLLIGVTAQNITHLHTFDEPLNVETANTVVSPFKAILERASRRDAP